MDGKSVPLLSGMAVTAEIKTERRPRKLRDRGDC